MEIEENGIYNTELILLKVLEVDSLLAGIRETSNQLSILKEQVNQVQLSIQELVSLEDAFKGQGGQAIRAFYQECHQPFLQFLESWIDEYQSYLKSFIGSLRDLEPSTSGFIRQEFLDHELKQGLKNTLQITAELTEEANEIMKSVSDIVALPRLEDGRFIQASKRAEDSSQETVEKLEDFDHRETAALDPILHELTLMNQYIQKMAGMFQSGSLSLTHYQTKTLTWKDFHEEISNPNSESEQSILQDMAKGVIEGASKAVEDTWEGLKSTYELGRTIMGPFSPLFLGNELLFNRDQLLENQRKHQEFYLGILNDPIGKVRQALDMPKYIWSAVSSAWERDVINGDAKSRTAFFTYGLTSLGIGILGDKGIGKAGTIAKTFGQAGKGEKALSIYTPVQAMAGGGLAQGPVPYNVLHDPLTKIKTVTDDVFGAKGITFKKGYDQHLREVEALVRKKNKGIVGGHNLKEFEKIFIDNGWDMQDYIISKRKHSKIEGIYEIEYGLPALNREGYIIPGELKKVRTPKTVYDPDLISDDLMLKWGEEAMTNGEVVGRKITGTSQNGLKFEGYIDETTGEVTNFFPTLNE
ncbi:T7SS effector LXG polymorphic toxin [Cytobacillus firmus]|uniref:T7SS effector LXG polymorphic toxin n=1 Tax=Cytobacillus firmus TaxID=1399 RepID=UPI0021639BA2|nr:T7SS effector LXG polymorphic toxin [Cytobacillus firmus]MCS0670734.1 T7SS effector LXG polymorphic toxin [Cytobacillus firmus]